MTRGCLQRAHIYIKPKHKVVIPGDNTCFVDYGNDLTRSMDDNWQGGQEWSAWVQTDRAGQRLHQEPAGIPAAEEQWGQFRADMCRQTGTSVRGWGGNVFLWKIWRERRASFIPDGVGGTIEGRTRTGRKDKIVSEWNAWRPCTLGAFVEKWLGKMTQETEFDKTTAKEKSEWSGGDLMHWGPGGRWYCSWWGRQVAGEDSFQFHWPPQSKTELGVPVEHLGTRVQDLLLHSWFNP